MKNALTWSTLIAIALIVPGGSLPLLAFYLRKLHARKNNSPFSETTKAITVNRLRLAMGK